MSVGKKRHYPVHDVMPRHFFQTADLAGVGTPVMRTIFEDFAANAVKQADAVMGSLAHDFPEQLIASVTTAIRNRTGLLAGAYADVAAD